VHVESVDGVVLERGLEQLELLERRAEGHHGVGHALGLGGGHRQRLEGDHAAQLGHVHVLRGESAAQHVVRGRHDLHAQPVQVRVHVAGGQMDGLTRGQVHAVEQDGHHHAGVVRVVLGDLEGRGQRGVALGQVRRSPQHVHDLRDGAGGAPHGVGVEDRGERVLEVPGGEGLADPGGGDGDGGGKRGGWFGGRGRG